MSVAVDVVVDEYGTDIPTFIAGYSLRPLQLSGLEYKTTVVRCARRFISTKDSSNYYGSAVCVDPNSFLQKCTSDVYRCL